jgi:membrane protease YdiL (CAAX protease family)
LLLIPLASGSGIEQVLVFSCAAVVGLIAAHAVMVLGVERSGWSSVWLDGAALKRGGVAVPALLGAFAVGLPSLMLLGAGWLDAEPAAGRWADWFRYGAVMLLTLIPAAAWEELAFRGYLLRVLRDRWGAWWAVGVTSVLFGLAHARSVQELHSLALVLVTLAGIFLGWMVLRRGSLYAAMAAHVAWNAVMAVLLHTEVSGVALGAAPVYRVVDSGPDWATGGSWGPEGGLAAGLGLTAALLYIMKRRERREEN